MKNDDNNDNVYQDQDVTIESKKGTTVVVVAVVV